MFDQYIKKIAAVTKRGDAREESYYRSLADLIEEFSQAKRKKKVHVTTLPKKTEVGNPDFRVWDGKHSQVGYLEAKPPKSDLDKIEKSDQLKRYVTTFPNLILTNFYEFRLYRDGKLHSKVQLAKPYQPNKHKQIPSVESVDEFTNLLERFFQYSFPTTFNAESLAKELAVRTRFLRDEVIKEELREIKSSGSKKILGFYEAFQKHLIANLTKDDFADMYAQTITYGLFAARTRSNGKFNRKIAYDLIPKTIGILRDIFHFISYDPPEQMAATVDDITEVLLAADVRKILAQYFTDHKGSDPIFHFYETFLAAYNPQLREQRGVYYTPEPIVSYIVQSLNIILKEKFGRADGLATQSVTVLDPAGGTLTFLAEAAKLAVEEYTIKFGKASRGKFVADHILKHFVAFELMMAPYTAGHLKMGYLLEELGHKLSGNERFKFYLTNTLEMEELTQTTLPVVSSLSEESHLASTIKKQEPILVILGNPPYSGISANPSEYVKDIKKGERYVKSYTINKKQENGRESYQLVPLTTTAQKNIKSKQKTWIGEQIENYKIIDGQWFGERKHWLQDDYVKFIRFAQWKIDQIGEGVVGFITNHAYLDNPTFRGMRQSLINSFDEIFILDLHGNSLRGEKSPDGSADENVFDIQQGVAIVLLVKRKDRKSQCRIYQTELWGSRKNKYAILNSKNILNLPYKELTPSSPFYFFVPKKETHKPQWDTYKPLNLVFPTNVTGIITARDGFAIDFEKEILKQRMATFGDVSFSPDDLKNKFKLKENYMWRIAEAHNKLVKETDTSKFFTHILYRPFDVRYIFFHDAVVWRTRREVMRHLLQENICLICPKRLETQKPWSHAFVSANIVDHVTVSLKTVDYCFPLYIYPDSERYDLFSVETSQRHVPNIAPKIFESLRTVFGKKLNEIQIFNYVYAIIFAPAYRLKYAEFLKSDFPHIPFTNEYSYFEALAEKGRELIELHLLTSRILDKPIAKCEGTGDLQVAKIIYDSKKKQVQFNQDNWFSNVPEAVWNYHVGGYQVAEKWLKDRKGRVLTSDEVATYTRIITALAETIKIQESLDTLFEQVENNLLEIKI